MKNISMKLYSRSFSIYKEFRKIKINLPKGNGGSFVRYHISLTSAIILKNKSFVQPCQYTEKIKPNPSYTSDQHVYTRVELQNGYNCTSKILLGISIIYSRKTVLPLQRFDGGIFILQTVKDPNKSLKFTCRVKQELSKAT